MRDYQEHSLGCLWRLNSARTRSIHAENPSGAPGTGGQTAGNLGPGRKGRPCAVPPVGSTVNLAAITGTGIIQHKGGPDAYDAGKARRLGGMVSGECP